MSARLALSVPCYGRADAVAQNLALISEEANALGVVIYYSDDTEDSSVENVVRDFAKRFPNIRYRRNTPSLGHDENVVQCLTWPDADYVWLLGDVWRPARGKLFEIMQALREQDLIFLNRRADDSQDVARLDGSSAIDFIREKLWNQTLTAATIYRRNVCRWVHEAKPDIKRNFPQLSVIMGYAAQHDVSVGWVATNPLEAAHSVGSYWYSNALSVFVDDWSNLLLSYDSIVPESDMKAILKSHSLNTNVFNRYFLLSLRKNGVLNWASIRRPYFWDAMHLTPGRVIAILMLPPVAARIVLKVRRTYDDMRKRRSARSVTAGRNA